jgi:hypothetical protein
MASALLCRTVKRYVEAGFAGEWRSYPLPIYLINVDKWLGKHAAWDLHQWSSKRRHPEPPVVNRDTICKLIPDEDVKLTCEPSGEQRVILMRNLE